MLAYIAGAAVVLAAMCLARGLLIYQVEAMIHKLSGARQRGKGSRYLASGSQYAPVHAEVLEGDLPVRGALPPALDGTYVRTGPNPKQEVSGEYHWFDGDGMVHATRIRKGKAAYANHWVQTSNFKQELSAGRALFLKLGDLHGRTGIALFLLAQLKELLGVTDSKAGTGTANTALAFHNKQLLTLQEQDLPYAVRVHGDAHMETLERVTFGGRLDRHPTFTAHPKKDPDTGELVGFGWSTSKPFLHYFVLDAGGGVKLDVPVDVGQSTFMHDFAITKDYAIFLDLPLTFDSKRMLAGGYAYEFEKDRPARFGVMPRGTADGRDVRWFELPPLYIFHVANAWQDGNTVVLFACVYQSAVFKDVMSSLPRMEQIRLDLATGAATKRVAADIPCEFPVVPAHLVGRECRYTYVAAAAPSACAYTGLAKLDLRAASPGAAVAGRLEHGAGWFGGEASFVPRAADPAALKGEDDGFLVTYVTHAGRGASELRVYDAASMADEPVAAVALPQRVPLGFHGLHVGEADFQSQFPFDIHFMPDL